MKFAQADFRKIQISALACIVLIVAGAGGVYFAHTVAMACAHGTAQPVSTNGVRGSSGCA